MEPIPFHREDLIREVRRLTKGEDGNPNAPCLGQEDVFFPKTGGVSRRLTQTAKEVCQECPAIIPCGEWAIINRVTTGVWGGMSATDREQYLWLDHYKAQRRSA